MNKRTAETLADEEERDANVAAAAVVDRRLNVANNDIT